MCLSHPFPRGYHSYQFPQHYFRQIGFCHVLVHVCVCSFLKTNWHMLPTEKDSLWDYLLSISRISLPSHPITTVTPSASEEDTQLLRSNSTWLYLAFPCDSIHKTWRHRVSPWETQNLTTRLRKGLHIEMGNRHMKRCSTLLTLEKWKLNYNEVPPHSGQNGHHRKVYK